MKHFIATSILVQAAIWSFYYTHVQGNSSYFSSIFYANVLYLFYAGIQILRLILKFSLIKN